MTNAEFLISIRDAAKAANQSWPEFVACEAAIDTDWDKVGLIANACNPFGIVPTFKEVGSVPVWPIRENRMIGGMATDIVIEYRAFDSLLEAYKFRGIALRNFNMYREARYADTAEEFIMQVSAQWREISEAEATAAGDSIYYSSFMGKHFRFQYGRWSMNPKRAEQVIALYDMSKDIF